MKMKRIILWCFILSMLLNLFPPVYAAEEQEDTIILTDTFYVPTTRKIHSLQVSFNPSWFRNDARIYNHDLAKLSRTCNFCIPPEQAAHQRKRADGL